MEKSKCENESKQRVLDAINKSKLPMGVETIRAKVGLKEWTQCRALCLELMADKRVFGQEMKKAWIFWSREGR